MKMWFGIFWSLKVSETEREGKWVIDENESSWEFVWGVVVDSVYSDNLDKAYDITQDYLIGEIQ